MAFLNKGLTDQPRRRAATQAVEVEDTDGGG
jgi:hypothetical protein